LTVDNYVATEIGDGADYIVVLFFTEINSIASGLLILIVDAVINIIKARKQAKLNQGK